VFLTPKTAAIVIT